MEETPALTADQAPRNEALCAVCNKNAYEPGHETKLCAGCRQTLIRYPIPKWIWIFGGCILLVMIAGMIRMPRHFSAAVHLSRAENAMDKKNYHTAQRELEQVLETFPGNTEVAGKLLIASGRNFDMAALSRAYAVVSDKSFTDKELLKEMEDVMLQVQSVIPQDSLLYEKIGAIQDSSELLVTYMDVLEGKPDFAVGGVKVADALYNREEYEKAESVLSRVLAKQPDMYSALILMAATKRNQKKYDEAHAMCDKLLAMNNEDVAAWSQKTRIELKRKQDKEAAVYASRAMEIDPASIVAMEAQAMVDYYAGRSQQSKALLADIQKKEMKDGDTTITARLRPIINGTKHYR